MPFRFALAPVLRLRQSIERQRTLQLQEASARLGRAREALAQLEHFLAEAARVDSATFADRRSGAELQFASVLRDNLHHYRQELRSDIQKLDILRLQAVAAYQQAYRAREALEAMRNRERQQYRREQLRHQQQELDAAYLLQRWHRNE